MQTGNVISLYEIGLRGRPIETIGEGDLAQPGAPTAWQRIRRALWTLVDVAREARALETRLLVDGRYRRFAER